MDLLIFEGLGALWAYLGRQRIADRNKEAKKQKQPGHFDIILKHF